MTLGWAAIVWLVFVSFTFEQKFPCSIDPMFSFLGKWFDVSPVPFLGAAAGYIKSLFLFGLTLVSVISWGGYSISKSVEGPTPLLARVTLSLLVGLIELSMVMAAVGFLGLLKPVVLFVLIGAAAASGFALARGLWGEITEAYREFKWVSLVDSPAKALIAVIALLAFAMAFVPELFYDALVYHLGLPHLYNIEGRILDTPNVYFSRSPMLIHMLYTFALGVDGDSLAKLVNLLFLAAGVMSAFVLCDKLGWPKAAPWAALAYLAIPIVNMNVWTTAVDAAMGGVFAMAAYSLLRWRESEKKIFWAVMTGLLSGAVFGIKYPGTMVVALMGGAMFALSIKKLTDRAVLLSLVLYGALAVAVVSPWLVRNYIWTGNPVYPILSSVFESRHINPEKMKNEKNATKASKPESVKELLLYPWTQTMKEVSNFNFIGPMMLGLLPLLFFLPFKDPSTRVFTAITFGYFFLELQVLGQLRYIMPGFLLLGVLAAGGIAGVSALMPLCGAFLKGAIFFVGLYHLVWIFQCSESRYLPVPVLLGNQSRADYAATMHNGLNLWPWNSMTETLLKLPDPCRVYILGTEQVHRFPRRFWYSAVHDSTPLVLWANESRDEAELYAKMREQGFTHLMLNVPELMRLEGYNLLPWSAAGRQNFIAFANRHLWLIDIKPIEKYENSLFLFELRDSLPGPSPIGNVEVFFGTVLKLAAS